MSILIDRSTRVLVQGITGRDGAFHTKSMLEYGTAVVAGVTPGKGGSEVHGVPVFNTVQEAVKATGANTSVIYVPAAFAADAVCEAADAGVKLIVCITEGVPTLDMVEVVPFVASKGARLIGPNCPGLISPGKSKVGILPGSICIEGPVGVVSRSGTLTYEAVDALTRAGLGQTTCLGIGGDPIIGTNFLDALAGFEADPDTKAVVMIGEIGGTDEENAARFIREKMKKPVVGFIAGQTAPPGKRMGHAGAIISGGAGTAADKIKALGEAGVPVARIPSEIPGLVRKALG
jgi:succinyl-CoA synthetase alpha subunit